MFLCQVAHLCIVQEIGAHAPFVYEYIGGLCVMLFEQSLIYKLNFLGINSTMPAHMILYLRLPIMLKIMLS